MTLLPGMLSLSLQDTKRLGQGIQGVDGMEEGAEMSG
jgi:hypothetical protein